MGNQSIQPPYDVCDPTDFFVISTRQDKHFGQFVFPKTNLGEHLLSHKALKKKLSKQG
ncbi:MepB family protein [Paenibacillus sp. Marseille-Q7038]